MPREVEFIIRLGPTDRYRHKHLREKERVIFFRVQYETEVNDTWYPVVRYDTAHGFAHRDLLDINGNTIKTPLFIREYNDALTFAESDLKANWGHYKKRFLEGKNG